MPPDLNADIRAFLDYLSVECGLSPNTVAAYRRDLRKFDEFIAASGISRLSRLTAEDVTRFLMGMKSRGLAVASVARTLVAVKMFIRFLVLEGREASSVVLVMESPRLWKTLPEVLSRKEVDRLLAAPDRNTVLGVRDAAVLETLYATGCRVQEVSDLRLGDLHLEVGYIHAVGKGRKERIVPVGEPAQEAIEGYLRLSLIHI